MCSMWKQTKLIVCRCGLPSRSITQWHHNWRKNGEMHLDRVPSKQKKMQTKKKDETETKRWEEIEGERERTTHAQAKSSSIYFQWTELHYGLGANLPFVIHSRRRSKKGLQWKKCHFRGRVPYSICFGARKVWASVCESELNYTYSVVWFVIVWVSSVQRGFEFSDKR